MQQYIECYDIGGTNIRGALVGVGAHRFGACGTLNPETKVYEAFRRVGAEKNIASRNVSVPVVGQSRKTEKMEIDLSEVFFKKDLVKSIRGDKDALINQIKEMSARLRDNLNNERVIAVSLGVPGPVEKNVLLEAPPLDMHARIDFSKELGFDCPVFVENDMNAAVLAELKFGYGRKVKSFYLLTISTGLGAGIVIDGKVLGGIFGEFGHCILERDMEKLNRCACGRLGCWGAMSSGYGIELSAKKEFGKYISTKEVFNLAEADKRARSIIERVRDYNAHGIGTMLNAFPADLIVVMGSIGLKQFDKIIPSKAEVIKYSINKVPEIVSTGFGEDIGLLGAYIVGKEKTGR